MSVLIITNISSRMQRSLSTCVNSWAEFKNTWRPTDFIAQVSGWSPQQVEALVRLKLDELILDEEALCYLFPQGLAEDHQQTIIKVVESEYSSVLCCELESLFYGQARQLLVYQNNCPSLSCYLGRYRLPKIYKELFIKAHKVCMRNHQLLVNRNVLISRRQYESLHQLSSQMKSFLQQQYIKPVKEFMALARQLLIDFKSQPGRTQILMEATNSQIRQQLTQLCQELRDLYICDRHYQTESHEIRDIKIVKQPVLQEVSVEGDESIWENNMRLTPSTTGFQHQNYDNQEWVAPIQQVNTKNQQGSQHSDEASLIKSSQLTLIKPSAIEQIRVVSVNGIKIQFKISLFPFNQSSKPTTVTLKVAKKYDSSLLQIEQLNVQHYEYHHKSDHSLLLTFSLGKQISSTPVGKATVCQCEFTVANSSGVSAPKEISLLYHGHPEPCQQLYVLGRNDEGLIPNFQSIRDPYSCLTTTENEWLPIQMECRDFSVGSAVVVTDNSGNVALWGQMNIANAQQSLKEDSELSDAIDRSTILKPDEKANTLFHQIGQYVIEGPTVIAQNKLITQVSCGHNYCLMLDLTGRAWGTGNNDFGQLGTSMEMHEPACIETDDLLEIVSLRKYFLIQVKASMNSISFAIEETGKLFRWGLNQIESSPSPVRDAFNNIINYKYPSNMLVGQSSPLMLNNSMIDEPIQTVDTNIVGTVFIKTRNNKLYAWGNTKFMGLGDRQGPHLSEFQRICNPIFVMGGVQKMAVGYYHCVVQKDNRELLGWGRKQYLSSAVNDKQKHFICTFPIAIDSQGVVDFTCGPNFTLFIKNNGKKTHVEIVGNKTKFPFETYPLPVSACRVQAAEGTIFIQ